ncbi:MAG TPA: homoserine kinase [Pyrinomonadaceae bacterium]|nr:homoserine kinase [Pyrinomonadaceae bacterium]
MDAAKKSASVKVPGSTSNLGAGFDCFGLALQIYLNVKAAIDPGLDRECSIEVAEGGENSSLPLSSDNLIYRAMRYAAEREECVLPPVELKIDNQIPISRGLGGSAAAIVAGIKLFDLLLERSMSNETALKYATELEGHADNAAPSLLGGFVVNCLGSESGVISLQRPWPEDIKVVVIVPEIHLDTKLARAALSSEVDHRDAVFNLQRVALFTAALAEGRYDLLWEAMKDRLHQPMRGPLVPGLADAMAVPRIPGLLGVALSGAGPSVVALAKDNLEEIGRTIAANFERDGISARVLDLEVDRQGVVTASHN